MNRPVKTHPALVLLLLIFIIPACQTHEKVKIKIDRFEKSLFSLPADSVAAAVPWLQQHYGEFFDLYSMRIIAIGDPHDLNYPVELAKFITDPDMKNVYQRVNEVYPNLKDIETGLGKVFSNYRKEFPDKVVPSVYTAISGFNQSMMVTDTILAIALDKYLGRDEDMYFMLDLANYQRYTMDKKYVVSDCMKAWMTTEFPYKDSIDNVLTNILYEGKIIYALRQMLPNTPDSLVFGFTPDQVKWCRNNTAQMWTFLVEKKMLFSADYLIINKLIGPGPFCSLFTRESPGRAPVWLGYQIIQSYMKHNKVTLGDLLSDNDYLGILAKAKFKP